MKKIVFATGLLLIAFLSIIGFYINNQRLIEINGQWYAYYCESFNEDVERSSQSIVIASEDDPASHTFIIRVNAPNRVNNPAWSSDNIIAFDHNYDIHIMGLNFMSADYFVGSRTSTIYSYPTWSPNGKQIIYLQHLSDLYLYDLDTSENTFLITLQAPAIPAWSPDGNEVAFLQDSQIIILDIESGESHSLIEIDNTGSHNVTWSPNGDSLSFSGSINGVQGLYQINIETREMNLILSSTSWSPAWSPDGNWIAFTSNSIDDNNKIGLYKIQIDGTNLQAITTDDSCDTVDALAWSTNRIIQD